jgi:hypothetical protein
MLGDPEASFSRAYKRIIGHRAGRGARGAPAGRTASLAQP